MVALIDKPTEPHRAITSYDFLPISARLNDRVSDLLILVTELRSELEHPDAALLVDTVMPVIEGTITIVNGALNHLSS